MTLEPSAALSSASLIVERFEDVSLKHYVLCFDREYYSCTGIDDLQSNGIAVFGTAKDFEMHFNSLGLFQFCVKKDG